jgi:hypothetical protein
MPLAAVIDVGLFAEKFASLEGRKMCKIMYGKEQKGENGSSTQLAKVIQRGFRDRLFIVVTPEVVDEEATASPVASMQDGGSIPDPQGGIEAATAEEMIAS